MPHLPDSRIQIEFDGLRKWFPMRRTLGAALMGRPAGVLKAVDGVSFALRAGEVLGIAGESGCGKSTTGMTAMQLLRPTAGEIRFGGVTLGPHTRGEELRAFRRRAQIVFQNPYESLNPRLTVADSVREPIDIHFRREPASVREDMLHRAMERAGLMPVANYLDRYPHELSGGQLQRVAIARAVAIEPSFLVADEPVSMLDVSIRAGVLNLFRYFSAEMRMAILYISHDLSTMRHVCHRVAVMYLGRIVEIGPAEQVLDTPRHPYARALMAAVPAMGARTRERVELTGAVPNAAALPGGCRFHPRCPQAMAHCAVVEPELRRVGASEVACHLYNEPVVAAAATAAEAARAPAAVL
ncbi:ABC transporter ATP-binding protein [Verticiella sediminum]|uniref:ABC transporter ATP-binding protein n=1 Tax=Verticiella sediminum TaxID=1247510 RepID=A0A556B281_9BURK|nr:ABC transporter ATP-binding protein [Verticiella sediminum]TSH99274.1 ABC transporter ATP-binding protein [Verticiella sediminum]